MTFSFPSCPRMRVTFRPSHHAQSSSGILFPLTSCPTPIGHPFPPHVIPDPDRASFPPSRHARPRSGILSPPHVMPDPDRASFPPSRHARPRSGIQGKESIFMRCVKGRKSGIHFPGCKAYAKDDGWEGGARMMAGEGRQGGRPEGCCGWWFFLRAGPPHVIPAHAGSRGNNSLSLQFHQVPKNNNLWFK